jgi:acetyl-CoA hydrolase
VGGQVDFIYGASRSKGGVPIIALPSTTTLKDGTMLSRIVAMIKQGAGIITSRNHVHYVVTEYGVADLYGKTICQRARQLIAVAHPDFRKDLEKQAAALNYI